jgi:hypothetical protein
MVLPYEFRQAVFLSSFVSLANFSAAALLSASLDRRLDTLSHPARGRSRRTIGEDARVHLFSAVTQVLDNFKVGCRSIEI